MPIDFDATLWIIVAGATMLGVIGGVIGCFALLRRQSLLGDSLAHAALPGVCIAFVVTGSKSPVPLLAGALVAGVLGSLLILAVVRTTRVKEDGAMGIVLSTFFGVGIVLLTWIQNRPGGNQSGLRHFLFGQAAALLAEDVVRMAILGVLVLAAVVVFYKEFQLITFDRDYAASIGLPVRTLEIGLTTLLVLVVVVGLQTVGVVLIIATLITPAVAARQWTNRLAWMLVLAAVIGGGSGAIGVLASAASQGIPTGPTIVLCSTALLGASLLFAPNRGIVQAWYGDRRLRRRIRHENLLKDIYSFGERRADFARPVSWPELMGLRGQGRHALGRRARDLRRRALVELDGDALRLTAAGRRAAERVVRKHRLWELYLTRRVDVASDHVHRDAEAMEHVLSDEATERIDALLGHPSTDPHGRPIPRPNAGDEAAR